MSDPSTPTSSVATQAVDSTSADDEHGFHHCRPPPEFPPLDFPPPDFPLFDSPLDSFRFDWSLSALPNQPNDLGARPVTDHTKDHTRENTDFQFHCVFEAIEVRPENLIEGRLSLRTGPDKAELPWKFITTLNIGHAERSGIRATLDLALEVRGATTGTIFTSACRNCSKEVLSGPSNHSLFAFVAQDNLIQITGGNARIGFRFRCLPRHHGTTDREYRLSVTVSDCGRILGQYQYPNWIKIVHHLTRGRNRAPVSLQQASETSSVLALGESEESHGAPLNAHFSGGSTSRTSAECLLPVQPSWTSAQGPVSNTFTQIHRANEEFEPKWQGSGLPAPATRSNNRIHEKIPVLSHINPNRGPKKGGDEIYLIVRNLSLTTDLYARFGGKIVPTSHIAPGVLSCRLPAAVHPGVVEVTLCQTPSFHDEGYGKSLVSFEYEEDSSEALIACRNTFNGASIISPGMTSAQHYNTSVL